MTMSFRTWLSALGTRLSGSHAPNAVDDRYENEAQFHIDMLADKLMREGMSGEDARRAALVSFGGRARHKEAARDEYRSRFVDDLRRDLLAGLRMLRRHPTFSIATVATMAIGIAATSSVFSVADAFLLRPLPFRDADRIVMLGDVQGSETWLPASYPEFLDWRSQSREASAVVAHVTGGMTYVSAEAVERLRMGRVSEGYFELLGRAPLVGRTFAKEDHADNAARVAVASRAFWRARFGERPDIVGTQVTINRQSYTIVGVVESGLELGTDPTQLWIPLEPQAPWKDRGAHYLGVLARMRDGATLQSLDLELDAIAKRAREANNTTHDVVAGGLRERIVGDARKPLLLLAASVGFLLLIALANVAGLLQARTASRATELAVRQALGAGHLRLVQQIVTESVMLALIGGAVGVALGAVVVRAFIWLWPTTMPRPVDVTIDGRVTVVAIGLALLGAILAAALTSIVRHGGSLTDRGTGGHFVSQRIRKTLVALEVAITVVLLVGAGLTARSLERILATNTGLRTDRVLTARLVLGRQAPEQRAFFGPLLERVRALPGVEEAGAITNLPLTGGGMSGDFGIEGRDFRPGEAPIAEKAIVMPGYFASMGIRLVRGRLFDSRDAAGTPEVALINETTARKLWPGADPIGQKIQVMGDSTHWQEIVGIVADTKVYTLEEQPGMITYVPFDQWPAGGLGLTIRTATPEPVAAALRNIVRELDPTLPVTSILPYERIIFRVSHGRRVPAVFLVSFAGIALLLAAVGLYGLLAYAVQQRRREMGVRMAVGAQRGAVLRLVLGEGITVAALGALLGLLAAFALARTIATLLYGVAATEPWIYAGAGLVSLLVAALASAIPARRASRVDPATALRSD
jgi:putative ABC transport system permease protein